MSESDVKAALTTFFAAHDSLVALDALKDNELYQEVLSNRFRLCYETLRSCLKRVMMYDGIDDPIDSGWQIFEAAIIHNLLTKNEDWFFMITDRNTLTHEYFEPHVNEICDRIETLYLPLFARARQVLETEIQKLNQGK